LWALPGEAPPPIDPKQLRAARDFAPVRPDFLDWAADVPHPSENAVTPAPGPSRSADPASRGELDWAHGAAPPTREPPPPPPMPAPRRPAAAGNEAAPAWQPPPPPPQRPAAAAGAPAQAWQPPPPPPRPAGGEPAPAWDQPPPPQRPAPGSGEPPPTWDQPAPTAERREPPGRPAVQATEERSLSAPSRTPPVSFAGGDVNDFVRALARAAGVSEQVFTQKDPQVVAEQLGQMLRVVVDNLSQLLNARVQAKRLVRSASHTVIQATDNNPLKFSPSAEEALRIMFGPSTRSYLDGQQALLQGFEDIKTHQVKTYSAMQHALTALLAELDPQTIDKDTEADRGIAAVVGSRKARLWDAYVARWQAKQRSEKGSLIEAFMQIFAQYYDDRQG
jgi:type VI secretion system protein ImpI